MQISPSRAKVDHFRAAITVLLLHGALFAVVRIRHTGAIAKHTPAIVAAIVAFIAHTNERTRAHVRVTDDTLTITLFTQFANCDSWLLPAHHQVRVVPWVHWPLVREVSVVYLSTKKRLEGLPPFLSEMPPPFQRDLDLQGSLEMEELFSPSGLHNIVAFPINMHRRHFAYS